LADNIWDAQAGELRVATELGLHQNFEEENTAEYFVGHVSWMSYYQNRWDRFLIAMKRSRVKPTKRTTTVMDNEHSPGDDDEDDDEENDGNNVTDD
jgi:hypothetical protein